MLTKAQQEALDKMATDVWYSAYDLQVRFSTMVALVSLGLCEVQYRTGSFSSPRTCTKFRRMVSDG